MDASDSNLVDRQNPWPGLSPYTESAQDYFFGRSQEIREIIARIEALPFTLLFGQSGLGKTSLLQAGLMPRLRTKNFLPVLVRLEYDPSSVEFEAQIAGYLLKALARIGAPALPRPPLSTEQEGLWEWLHRVDTELVDAAGQVLTPILIFDQFEEIFTLGERDPETRARTLRWFRSLAGLAENWCPDEVKTRLQNSDDLLQEVDLARRPLRVLVGMREDYLPHLDEREDEMPSMMLNRLRLTALRGTQAIDSVHEPAPQLVTRQMAETIVRFVAGDKKSELRDVTVAPPILNLVCRKLNERRQNRGLAQITPALIEGDSGMILREFYEESVADQPQAVRMFIEEELLSDSGYRENISEERAERIMARADVPPKALEVLVARRLLQKEERLGRIRLELIHDVLCAPIAQARAERAEREKAERAEADRKIQLAKNRRLSWAVAACSALLIVFAGLLIFALLEARKAKQTGTQISNLLMVFDDSRYSSFAIASAHPEFLPMQMGILTHELSDIDFSLKNDGPNERILLLRFQTLTFLANVAPSTSDDEIKQKVQYAIEAGQAAGDVLKESPDPEDRLTIAKQNIVLMKTLYVAHQDAAGQECYDRELRLLVPAIISDTSYLHHLRSVASMYYYKARTDPAVDDQGRLSQAAQDKLLVAALDEARESYKENRTSALNIDQYVEALALRAKFLGENKMKWDEMDKDVQQVRSLEAPDLELSFSQVGVIDMVSYRRDLAEALHDCALAEKAHGSWQKAELAFNDYVRLRGGTISSAPEKEGADYNVLSEEYGTALAYRDEGDFEIDRSTGSPADHDAALALAQTDYSTSRTKTRALLKENGNSADYWKLLAELDDDLENTALDEAPLKQGDDTDIRNDYRWADQDSEDYCKYLARTTQTASGEDLAKLNDRLIEERGNLAYRHLFVRRYDEALQEADAALRSDPSRVWIYTNQAHALLLLGREEEAWKIYQEHAADKLWPSSDETFAHSVLADFRNFDRLRIFFTPDQLAAIQRMATRIEGLSSRPQTNSNVD